MFRAFDEDDNLRIAAFFFDVHVQQGSMSKKQPDGSHKPDVLTDPSQATGQRAVDLATSKGMTKTATAWQQVLDSTGQNRLESATEAITRP